MRCKKHHPSDPSSSVGVCATCLRERLRALIAAQEKAHHLARVSSRAASDDQPRKSDPNPPPPLVFPRSVSPYVSRRKSDYANWQSYDSRQNSLFYSTPQVGPTFGIGTANSAFNGRTASSSKKFGKFRIFSGLFRSRSGKFEANRRNSSHESCEPSSSASPSWFSMIFSGRRKNPDCRMCSADNPIVRGRRRHHRQTDRGMSPVTTENLAVDCVGDDRSPSGSAYSTETSPQWRKTPSAAPSTTRRCRPGRNVSGMAFCLSPLVRASPNPHWNPKGLPPDMTTVSGEIRSTAAKPHLSTASSFCANRSRKLADFGRANQNR